ncbi:hypothetical protein VSH64_29580 [Amycolatopsis rhabdoformis]|uniref:Uncharacterized protein n=1 Tax=Amycolatopsis rhabdoformis TaxID=1448059 RepID=A0ABZ1HZR3_9PSEU|nr:hypothetical protein [Amycolatopsis rhabdoformis]WSE27011.1 hypothetical protein VSH64_29580 [Amycolatopsis rhabdoformis]
MARKRPQVPVPPWTQRDEVLRYTCHLAMLMGQGHDLGHLQEVLAPFPPTNARDERLLAAGPFVLSDFRALGDGSWNVSTPFVFGTGALGVGLVAGSLVGGAVAKSRARNAAAANAVPRWVPIEQGTVYLSEYGFYLHTPRVLAWNWPSITGATMAGPGLVHLTGDSQNGSVSWLLQSDWAELVFVAWANAVHPRHPQFVTGQWLPPGWVEHARYHQRPPDPVPGMVPELPPEGDGSPQISGPES